MSAKETNQIPPSPQWYRSITQLPLYKYMDIVVDNNLHALIISGTPTQEELESAWTDIQMECSDVAGTLEHKYYLSTFRDIHALETVLTQIEQVIGYLEAWAGCPVPEDLLKTYWEKLEMLMFEKFVFTPSNEKKYRAQLRGIYNRSRSIKIDLDLKLLNFKDIEKAFAGKSDKPTKVTREYFYSLLISISDVAHYNITDSITVFEFYERLRRYNELANKLNSQKHKHGRL